MFVMHRVYFVRVYQPLDGFAETQKKLHRKLGNHGRSCNENFLWRVWNHIWLLDMAVKKGQHGDIDQNKFERT